VEEMEKTYRNRCVLRNNLVEFKYNGHCGAKKVADPKDDKKDKKERSSNQKKSY